MQRMTRQEMIAEFGEPGVENPMLMDLITADPVTGSVVLVMIERRPWGASPRQFSQIEEKINRYLGYALDGFLAEQYPIYLGKPVQIRLDCAQAPHGDAVAFVEAAQQATGAHGIAFAVNVVPFPA
jgi:hypothetical protein